jgi:hypothetical protein
LDGFFGAPLRIMPETQGRGNMHTAIVALIAVLLVTWLGARERAANARAEQAEHCADRMRSELAEHHWREWWTRNAFETTPLDAVRPDLIRFALASHLVPVARFAADMRSLAADECETDLARSAARCFSSEFFAREKPWIAWQNSGKETHNERVLQLSYGSALRGWPDLLKGARD